MDRSMQTKGEKATVVIAQSPSHVWLFEMGCSTPGLTSPHHLPKFAQVHVHCIGEAIQPSHPLMPSFPSALKFSQLIDTQKHNEMSFLFN